VPGRLSRAFFDRPTRSVARALLGCRLVRRIDGQRLSGWIVETEAYIGERDRAAHSSHGRTPRTAVMFGAPGVAYVYFTYGMHWLFNVVTEADGFPAAVLVRALEPVEGVERMQQHRGRRPIRQLCSGPAKLTQALRIDGRHNGVDLCARNSEIWIEAAQQTVRVGRSARIGIERVPEPWLSRPWRYFVKDNRFVSR
jgi:DNA-3-methyladenine glycosylase